MVIVVLPTLDWSSNVLNGYVRPTNMQFLYFVFCSQAICLRTYLSAERIFHLILISDKGRVGIVSV